MPLEYTHWIMLPILAPLAVALASFVLGGNWNAPLGAIATALVGAGAAMVTWLVWQQGPISYPLGSWPVPLGICIYADGLSCAMLLMSATVGGLVGGYSIGYFKSAKSTQYWPLWLVLWSAINALFLSADIFNLYVTLELVTLTAVGLVLLADTREATAAALNYLLAALAGSLLYLAGVALLYGKYGALDIATLHQQTSASVLLSGTLLLMLLGLMFKSAVFPFHFWLPAAHGSAPPPSSALLSALVVKASFYILLRLWFQLFPAAVTQAVAMLPATLGALAILWGSAQAIVTPRLKMLVAYSTIAQVGYLFLVFGLAPPHSSNGFVAYSAIVLFALSHALAKSSLFLAAGTIMYVTGTDSLHTLPTVARRLPITFFSMGCASVGLMGLPPTAAFTAKWALLTTALDRGSFVLAAIIATGGLLAAWYLFRILAAAFATPGQDDLDWPTRLVPRLLEYSSLTLALASLVLGLASWPLIELLQIGSPWHTAALEGVVP